MFKSEIYSVHSQKCPIIFLVKRIQEKDRCNITPFISQIDGYNEEYCLLYKNKGHF